MSRFQVFLIVLYLFFFGGVGGWVLELFFRRFFSGANPERKWLNPRLPVRPLPAALRLRHGAAVYSFGTRSYALRLVFRHVLVLSRDVCRHGAGDDAAGIHRRPCELQGLPSAPLGLQQTLGQYPGHYLPAVHVFLGRFVAGVLLPALSETPEAGRVVRSAPAGLVHGRRVLRHFPDRSVLLCPSGSGRAEKAAQIDKSVYDAIDVQKLWHKMQSRGGFFRFVSIKPLTERIDAFDEFLHRRPGGANTADKP